MTEQEQQIALCKWAGWTNVADHPTMDDYAETGISPSGVGTDLPNTDDLNVLHEMEKKLSGIQLSCYCELLLGGRHHTGWSDNWPAIHATAAQRRKALGKALGLWK